MAHTETHLEGQWSLSRILKVGRSFVFFLAQRHPAISMQLSEAIQRTVLESCPGANTRDKINYLKSKSGQMHLYHEHVLKVIGYYLLTTAPEDARPDGKAGDDAFEKLFQVHANYFQVIGPQAVEKFIKNAFEKTQGEISELAGTNVREPHGRIQNDEHGIRNEIAHTLDFRPRSLHRPGEIHHQTASAMPTYPVIRSGMYDLRPLRSFCLAEGIIGRMVARFDAINELRATTAYFIRLNTQILTPRMRDMLPRGTVAAIKTVYNDDTGKYEKHLIDAKLEQEKTAEDLCLEIFLSICRQSRLDFGDTDAPDKTAAAETSPGKKLSPPTLEQLADELGKLKDLVNPAILQDLVALNAKTHISRKKSAPDYGKKRQLKMAAEMRLKDAIHIPDAFFQDNQLIETAWFEDEENYGLVVYFSTPPKGKKEDDGEEKINTARQHEIAGRISTESRYGKFLLAAYTGPDGKGTRMLLSTINREELYVPVLEIAATRWNDGNDIMREEESDLLRHLKIIVRLRMDSLDGWDLWEEPPGEEEKEIFSSAAAMSLASVFAFLAHEPKAGPAQLEYLSRHFTIADIARYLTSPAGGPHEKMPIRKPKVPEDTEKDFDGKFTTVLSAIREKSSNPANIAQKCVGSYAQRDKVKPQEKGSLRLSRLLADPAYRAAAMERIYRGELDPDKLSALILSENADETIRLETEEDHSESLVRRILSLNDNDWKKAAEILKTAGTEYFRTLNKAGTDPENAHVKEKLSAILLKSAERFCKNAERGLTGTTDFILFYYLLEETGFFTDKNFLQEFIAKILKATDRMPRIHGAFIRNIERLDEIKGKKERLRNPAEGAPAPVRLTAELRSMLTHEIACAKVMSGLARLTGDAQETEDMFRRMGENRARMLISGLASLKVLRKFVKLLKQAGCLDPGKCPAICNALGSWMESKILVVPYSDDLQGIRPPMVVFMEYFWVADETGLVDYVLDRSYGLKAPYDRQEAGRIEELAKNWPKTVTIIRKFLLGYAKVLHRSATARF